MGGSKQAKNVKQITAQDSYGESLGSYNSIEAGISTRMALKYCDVSGFSARYTDPKTKLRYFSAEHFQLSKAMPDATRNKLLAIRKANPTLC